MGKGRVVTVYIHGILKECVGKLLGGVLAFKKIRGVRRFGIRYGELESYRGVGVR